MFISFIKWLFGIPLGIILYTYDDILWGPAPIALANKILGWPFGLIFLCIIYLIISYVASHLILTHFRNLKYSTKSKNFNTKSFINNKYGYTYKLLINGRWVGLAVSCFMLGAILTSIAVGKLQLFKDIKTSNLAAIMSVLFVSLFLGFYGGLFTIMLKYGLLYALLLFGIIATFIQLLHIKHGNHPLLN